MTHEHPVGTEGVQRSLVYPRINNEKFKTVQDYSPLITSITSQRCESYQKCLWIEPNKEPPNYFMLKREYKIVEDLV